MIGEQLVRRNAFPELLFLEEFVTEAANVAPLSSHSANSSASI
jgi:hypothetical protein